MQVVSPAWAPRLHAKSHTVRIPAGTHPAHPPALVMKARINPQAGVLPCRLLNPVSDNRFEGVKQQAGEKCERRDSRPGPPGKPKNFAAAAPAATRTMNVNKSPDARRRFHPFTASCSDYQRKTRELPADVHYEVKVPGRPGSCSAAASWGLGRLPGAESFLG
jgi:hypothetical protein